MNLQFFYKEKIKRPWTRNKSIISRNRSNKINSNYNFNYQLINFVISFGFAENKSSLSVIVAVFTIKTPVPSQLKSDEIINYIEYIVKKQLKKAWFRQVCPRAIEINACLSSNGRRIFKQTQFYDHRSITMTR